jgi:hypothetical protein
MIQQIRLLNQVIIIIIIIIACVRRGRDHLSGSVSSRMMWVNLCPFSIIIKKRNTSRHLIF